MRKGRIITPPRGAKHVISSSRGSAAMQHPRILNCGSMEIGIKGKDQEAGQLERSGRGDYTYHSETRLSAFMYTKERLQYRLHSSSALLQSSLSRRRCAKQPQRKQ